MLKKVLITGAAGFLGSHLAKDLIAEGCMVIGIDNMYSGKLMNIKDLPNQQFIFKKMDVCSKELLDDPDLKTVQEIYHFASPASPRYYQMNPFGTINANTVGTENMLELAKCTGAKIVYTSTSEAYGEPEIHPQPETYRGNVNTWGPRACYDESKRLGEVLCYLYFTHYHTQVKVARLFNTYSAGLANDDGRVISNFVTQALTGEDITVYGDGSQTRSFCYVTDTINGLKLMMEKEAANGEIINIGNPIEYKILDLAYFIKDLTVSRSNIVFVPLPENDPKVRRPDIEKASKILEWEPIVSLEEGLNMTIHDYKSKLKNCVQRD